MWISSINYQPNLKPKLKLQLTESYKSHTLEKFLGLISYAILKIDTFFGCFKVVCDRDSPSTGSSSPNPNGFQNPNSKDGRGLEAKNLN